MHMREIHPAALEYLAFLNYAAYTTTAHRTIPKNDTKRLAVNFLKVRDDVRLQSQEIIFDCVGVHGLNLTTEAQRQKEKS